MPQHFFVLSVVGLAAIATAIGLARAPTSTAAPGVATLAAPPVALPTVRTEFNPPGLVLTGRVPDAAERSALVRRAQALYGANNVSDQLQTGGVANPSWLSPAFMPDLRGALRASAVLENGRWLIEGEVPNEPARAAVAASVAGFGASGVDVENRLRVR